MSPDAADRVRPGRGERPDPDEFAEFYEKHRERLILYLRSLGAGPPDADDIAAETFWLAADQWSSIRYRSWRWLRVVARHRYLRYAGSRPQHVYVDEVPDCLDRDEDPAANTYARELLEEIRHLPPRQREVFALKADGYNDAEIAGMLGIAASTVRLQLHRARERLKLRLDDAKARADGSEMPRTGQHAQPPLQRLAPGLPDRGKWPESSVMASLTDTERAALLAAGTPVQFEDEEILALQGAAAGALYMLTGGMVKVTFTAESGAETILAVRSRGDLIGERVVLDRMPYTATARAAGAVGAVRISQARLAGFGQRYPAVLAAITSPPAGRARGAERHAAERAGGARARLAQVIYELAADYGEPVQGGEVRIPLPLTQTDLGKLAGVPASTIHRVLSEFRKEGVIATGYSEIAVRDMESLRASRADSGVSAPTGHVEPMLLYLIKQVELAVRSRLDDVLQPAGLTAQQYIALTVLERHRDMSSAQLARTSFVTAQPMADMITALEGRGLIERYRDRADRRRLVVALTAEGRALLARYRDTVASLEADMLAGLSQSEVIRLRSSLHACHVNLTRLP